MKIRNLETGHDTRMWFITDIEEQNLIFVNFKSLKVYFPDILTIVAPFSTVICTCIEVLGPMLTQRHTDRPIYKPKMEF